MTLIIPPSPIEGFRLWDRRFRILTVHTLAIYAILFTRPSLTIVVMAVCSWALAMLGVTMGYHRLWSHRSFEACAPVRLLLALFGALGVQGSIAWWARDHRLHHRFTDTEDDPYNINEGFWHAHLGWLWSPKPQPKLKLIDVSDLEADWVVCFQQKYITALTFSTNVIAPIVLAWLWGESSWMTFLWMTCVARMVGAQGMYILNSFGHYTGSQDFDEHESARGNFWVALLTHGEGWHNFHHAFPLDYRNGHKWWMYDPSKWVIKLLSYCGLTYALKETPDRIISRAQEMTAELKDSPEELRKERPIPNYPRSSESKLPAMSEAEFLSRVEKGSKLFVLKGRVVDVTEFIKEHPGGAGWFGAWIGKTMPEDVFATKYNRHSRAAQTDIERLYIARYQPIHS